MRVISVSALCEGDIVGKAVYSDQGRMLLGEGVELTRGLIERIQAQNLYYVYIKDSFSEGIEPRSVIDDATIVKSTLAIKESMNALLKENRQSKIKGLVPLKHYKALRDIIDELFRSIEENSGTLYSVMELMGTDMYTYRHSVNVAVLSILTARSMGYDVETVKHIAMGGLLHDLGKTAVPLGILNKPGPLEEEEFEKMKEHPELGYEMIRDDRILSGYTKQIVRLHHEKLDGSGYGMGLSAGDIPKHVRLVTICDMFDAMTNHRIYRGSMPTYQALEVIMADSVYKLDTEIYPHFVKNICLFPVGSGVELSDGTQGIVVKYKPESPTRPVVRLIGDGRKEVDLERERTLFVSDSVDLERI